MLREVLRAVISMGNPLGSRRVIFAFNEYFKSSNDIIIEILLFISDLETSGEMKGTLSPWGLPEGHLSVHFKNFILENII